MTDPLSGEAESQGDLHPDLIYSKEELGRALRDLRRRHARLARDSQFTFRELEARSGIPRAAINDYFNGRSLPPTDRLDVLVQLLGATPREQKKFADARDRVEELSRSLAPSVAATGGSAQPVPRQLPAARAPFIGRALELGELTALADGSSETSAAVVSAIDGTGGVGKTSLALHWARLAADRFADGQLYVDLRGYDPSGKPLDTDQVVRGFLDALGVTHEAMPRDSLARLGRYRSLLASRRVLVVLDNARGAEQVRDLLPSGPDCMAVITSRSDLSGLIATHGAVAIQLGLFTHDEARSFLEDRLGLERCARESEAVDGLIRLCARLPLALAVVSARAKHMRGSPLRMLVRELEETAEGRLGSLSTDDPATNLRTVLSHSYAALSLPEAQMFRFCALHPGPALSLAAAASLAGKSLSAAADLLDQLVRARLIDRVSAGRFAMHDLLRAYARELTEQPELHGERTDALARVYDHYLRTAFDAARMLSPKRKAPAWTAQAAGVTAEPLSSLENAWSWFDAESPGLASIVSAAAAHGFARHAVLIPRTLTVFFERRGRFTEFISCQGHALAMAERTNDREGQAHAHRGLGRAWGALNAPRSARTHLESAVAMFHDAALSADEARSRIDLAAWVFEEEEAYEDALAQVQAALEIFTESADEPGQSRCLNNEVFRATSWARTVMDGGDPVALSAF